MSALSCSPKMAGTGASGYDEMVATYWAERLGRIGAKHGGVLTGASAGVQQQARW
jgi:hypothetical protein